METWNHLRAILVLPVTVTVVIPGGLLYFFGTDTFGLWHSLSFTRILLPAISAALVLVGLLLLVETIRLLATIGKGTLAPWNPPQKLVVQGVYRRVRNPMISGVFLILLGEAVGFGSLPILVWAMVFIVGNMIYIPLVEEPGLTGRFGEEYDEYRRNVPRWIPRRKGWDKSNTD